MGPAYDQSDWYLDYISEVHEGILKSFLNLNRPLGELRSVLIGTAKALAASNWGPWNSDELSANFVTVAEWITEASLANLDEEAKAWREPEEFKKVIKAELGALKTFLEDGDSSAILGVGGLGLIDTITEGLEKEAAEIARTLGDRELYDLSSETLGKLIGGGFEEPTIILATKLYKEGEAITVQTEKSPEGVRGLQSYDSYLISDYELPQWLGGATNCSPDDAEDVHWEQVLRLELRGWERKRGQNIILSTELHRGGELAKVETVALPIDGTRADEAFWIDEFYPEAGVYLTSVTQAGDRALQGSTYIFRKARELHAETASRLMAEGWGMAR